MAKFIVLERMLCEVTFVKRVEAKSLEDAYEAHYDGESVQIGAEIGDAHAAVDDIEILPDAPHNIPAAMYSETGEDT